jgi:hypothetical protein
VTDVELKGAIKLIKAVKKLGVIRMKMGTLEFELSENFRADRPALKMSKEKIAKAEELHQLQMRFNEVNEDLSTMHVEDPSGFERAIVEQELSGELSSGDNIEETQNF